MKEEKEKVRQNGRPGRALDGFDRKILAALTADAGATYAEIGRTVGLSAPAVHERVRRLRSNGTLAGTTTRIHGPSVGKPFLAFVHIDADGWGKSQRLMTLRRFPEVEEMHSVAGDTCVILKVRTASAQAMEEFLSQIYVLPGIRGTKSYVVLSTYLERPVQAEVTSNWPPTPLKAD